MHYNYIVDFRRILKLKPRELPVHLCYSMSSPECLKNFIQTRYFQSMCEECIKYNCLEEAHPYLDFEDENISVHLYDPEDDDSKCYPL